MIEYQPNISRRQFDDATIRIAEVSALQSDIERTIVDHHALRAKLHKFDPALRSRLSENSLTYLDFLLALREDLAIEEVDLISAIGVYLDPRKERKPIP